MNPDQLGRDDVLFVSDLDGTLLSPEGRLTGDGERQLRWVLDQGVAFTVASARSIHSIREILGADLPLRWPVVECNGAFLTDYQSGEHVDIFSMEAGVTRAVFEHLRERGAVLFITGTNGDRDAVFFSGHRNGGLDWYLADRRRFGDPRLTEVEDLAEGLSGRVVCLTAVGTRVEMEQLEVELRGVHGEQLTMHVWDDPYARDWWWLMIHDRGACKGKAVERMLQSGGNGSGCRRVVAYGDQVNDVGLFDFADYAVAPSNACVPVRSRANEVIGPHEEDSVILHLTEWVRRMKP